MFFLLFVLCVCPPVVRRDIHPPLLAVVDSFTRAALWVLDRARVLGRARVLNWALALPLGLGTVPIGFERFIGFSDF
jgi:hypothetical protein